MFDSWANSGAAVRANEANSAKPAAPRRPVDLARKLVIWENLLHCLNLRRDRLVQIKKPTRKYRHQNKGDDEKAGSTAHDSSFFWVLPGPFGFMPPGQFTSIRARMRRNLGATARRERLIYSHGRAATMLTIVYDAAAAPDIGSRD